MVGSVSVSCCGATEQPCPAYLHGGLSRLLSTQIKRQLQSQNLMILAVRNGKVGVGVGVGARK